MVSEESPSNSNSSILHQFIISNSIDQNQFGNHHFDSYAQSLPLNMQSLGGRMPRSVDFLHAPLPDESDVSHGGRLMDLLGTSNEGAHQAQRLQLSLGSAVNIQRPLNSPLIDPTYLISAEVARQTCSTGLDRMMTDFCFSGSAFIPSTASQNQSFSFSLNATESLSAAIGSSKYLKPAQSLLEETVTMGSKKIDSSNQKYVEKLSRGSKNGSFGLASELKADFFRNEVLSEKNGAYVNLLKLLALLEEVERRYEEYYHHMEELVSSFEVIAGLGAGKSYTALALQAMSKHFCSLRNAIMSQIQAVKAKDR